MINEQAISWICAYIQRIEKQKKNNSPVTVIAKLNNHNFILKQKPDRY